MLKCLQRSLRLVLTFFTPVNIYIYIYCHDGFIYLAQKKKDISTSVSVLKT